MNVVTSEPLDLTTLDAAESELADVEHVLVCVDRDDPGLCAECVAGTADGSLAERPALARCAAERRRGQDETRPNDQD